MQVKDSVTKVLTLLLVVFVAGFSADFAKAQSGQGYQVAGASYEIKSMKRQMQMMQERINQLEEMVQEQQSKAGVKSASKSDWTEGIKGKLKKGSGLTWKSDDGAYEMRFRLRGLFRATMTDADDEAKTTEWDIPSVRLVWDGNAVVPWFKYKLQIDASDSDVELRDLKFQVAYNKLLSPVFGQYKVPFNREEGSLSSALQFVDRSIVNQFTFGRDRGIGLTGKSRKMLGYHIGAFQGEGRNAEEGDQNEKDSNFLWTGRVMVNPFGTGLKLKPNFAKEMGLQLGLGFAYLDTDIRYNDVPVTNPDGTFELDPNGKKVTERKIVGAFDETDSSIFDKRSRDFTNATAVTMTAWTADISFVHPMGNLEAEYVGMWVDPSGDDMTEDKTYDYGFRVQGGFFIVPKTLEVGARYAMLEYDDDLALGGDANSSTEWTGGVSYYLSKDHRLKFQADFSRITDEDSDGVEVDESRFRAQLQAYF